MTGRREGAALVLALLLLVVLDCIVLGTLHLSLQEHRIGANRAEALRLRLDAESGARRALAHWATAIDTMAIGSAHRLPVTAAASGRTSVHIERLTPELYLIDAAAVEEPPRVGHASARLLVLPPPLPPGTDAAPAPLVATGPVQIGPTARLVAASPMGCDTPAAPYATLTHGIADVIADPGAHLDAPAGLLSGPDLVSGFDRIAHLSTIRASSGFIPSDTTISAAGTGLLIVRGNLILAGGVSFDGLLIVQGTATIEAGAVLQGALHAASAIVDGSIIRDPCIVRDVVAAARVDRPYPAGRRAWLPSF